MPWSCCLVCNWQKALKLCCMLKLSPFWPGYHTWSGTSMCKAFQHYIPKGEWEIEARAPDPIGCIGLCTNQATSEYKVGGKMNWVHYGWLCWWSQPGYIPCVWSADGHHTTSCVMSTGPNGSALTQLQHWIYSKMMRWQTSTPVGTTEDDEPIPMTTARFEDDGPHLIPRSLIVGRNGLLPILKTGTTIKTGRIPTMVNNKVVQFTNSTATPTNTMATNNNPKQRGLLLN